MSKTTNAAFNGLNYVGAFKAAFAEQNIKERVSIEHMETFFFLLTARNLEGVELRRLQKALGYAQAKMSRTAATLETLGWIKIEKSKTDERQKDVEITESGRAFFTKLGAFLSTEDGASVFKKRSAEMQDEIREDAEHREAVRSLEDGWDPFGDDDTAKVAQPNPTKPVELGAEFITASRPRIGKPAIQRVDSEGQPLSRAEINKQLDKRASAQSRTHEEVVRSRSITKMRRDQNDKAREQIRDVLRQRGEKEIEVGEKYIRTHRKIVTFPVIFKRTGAKSLKELVTVFRNMDENQLDDVLTPNPKTKIDRLKAELNSYLNRGWEPIDGNPHLMQRVHIIQSEIAAIEAKLDQGIGSLKDNPITKAAWYALMKEAEKERATQRRRHPIERVKGKRRRSLLDVVIDEDNGQGEDSE